MEHVSQVVVDEIFEDRRSRVKTNVHYDDGLTEEQWLAVRLPPSIPPSTFDPSESELIRRRCRHWKRMKIRKKQRRRNEPRARGEQLEKRSERWERADRRTTKRVGNVNALERVRRLPRLAVMIMTNEEDWYVLRFVSVRGGEKIDGLGCDVETTESSAGSAYA